MSCSVEFPQLPAEFVEWMKRKGKQRMTLAELVEEYKKWKNMCERGDANG